MVWTIDTLSAMVTARRDHLRYLATDTRLLFQRVPEPKQVKNRVHLDINAAPGRRAERNEVDAEVARLTTLGATVLRTHDGSWGPYPEYYDVMADPEDNEFCIH